MARRRVGPSGALTTPRIACILLVCRPLNEAARHSGPAPVSQPPFRRSIARGSR